ncbi:hypothetical protein LZ30DRAFT_710889 [Colletotrichum cereale]|nr:hypothetical protein LZ30DRAFT_710889 [Colletotrichum cereale]
MKDPTKQKETIPPSSEREKASHARQPTPLLPPSSGGARHCLPYRPSLSFKTSRQSSPKLAAAMRRVRHHTSHAAPDHPLPHCARH